MRLTILFVSLLQLLEQHPVEDGRGRPLNRRCVTTSRAGSGCSGELAEPIELITELWVGPGLGSKGEGWGLETLKIVGQKLIDLLIQRLCGRLYWLTKLSKNKDGHTRENEVPTSVFGIVQDHGVLRWQALDLDHLHLEYGWIIGKLPSLYNENHAK